MSEQTLEQKIKTATIMLNSMIYELELKQQYATRFHKFTDIHSLERLRIIKEVLHPTKLQDCENKS